MISIAIRFLRARTPEQRAAVDLDTHYTKVSCNVIFILTTSLAWLFNILGIFFGYMEDLDLHTLINSSMSLTSWATTRDYWRFSLLSENLKERKERKRFIFSSLWVMQNAFIIIYRNPTQSNIDQETDAGNVPRTEYENVFFTIIIIFLTMGETL